MIKKRIFTHVSPKAVEGIRRLSTGSEVHVLAAPGTGGYTVVTLSRDVGRRDRGESGKSAAIILD